MAMDKMTDEELRAFRDQKIIELRAYRRQFHPKEMSDGNMYPRIFFPYDLLHSQGIGLHDRARV